MKTREADLETGLTEQPNDLSDRAGDVTPAVTPRQMAFMALIAGIILAILRRVFAGRRRGKQANPDPEG
jgi:hypothetical protein